MISRNKFACVLPLLALLAGSPQARAVEEVPADLILKVGRIWTGDPDRPWAEALACRSGEVVAVGTLGSVERFRGAKTRVVDLPDAFATPGLVDSHAHLISLGANLEEVELRGATSPEEVARRVKGRIDAEPGDGWVFGAHWDQSLWPGGAFPTSAALDTVAPSRPVWLSRVDGHAGWANAEAMRRAGVSKDSKAPVDGQIIRDAEGRPTGIFVDGARALIDSAIPGGSGGNIARRILAAQAIVLKAGLTGIHDAGVDPGAEAEAYRRLEREGTLKLRVYAMAGVEPSRAVDLASRPPAPSGPSDRFVMRSISSSPTARWAPGGPCCSSPTPTTPATRG